MQKYLGKHSICQNGVQSEFPERAVQRRDHRGGLPLPDHRRLRRGQPDQGKGKGASINDVRKISGFFDPPPPLSANSRNIPY